MAMHSPCSRIVGADRDDIVPSLLDHKGVATWRLCFAGVNAVGDDAVIDRLVEFVTGGTEVEIVVVEG